MKTSQQLDSLRESNKPGGLFNLKIGVLFGEFSGEL
jgi:hypothetical protein